MKQVYSSPRSEVSKSSLRASILAGSNQVIKGHDFEGEGFSARERSTVVTD